MNVDAKIIKCSNQNMYVKMERLKDIIMNTSESIRVHTRTFPDAAVLTEMSVMGNLSMKCDHCPTKYTDVMSYERPIPNKTPSYIEDMSMCMTANSNAIRNLRLRQNKVTSAIISDCISVLEFMDRFENRPEDVGTIVLATYPSVTHAATVAYTFECISAYSGWDGTVNMVVITDENTKVAMEAYVGPRLNVNLVNTRDQLMCLNQMINAHDYGYMTVVTHNDTCSRALMSMNKRTDVDINVVMSLDTLKTEAWVRNKCTEMGMLMEMCPCSKPNDNVVRIVPISRDRDVSEMTTRIRHMDTPVFGFMRWYTVMIRRMKVDETCYDCAIALKLAYSILYLMSGREMDMSAMSDRQWVENFKTTLNTQDLLE
jgi:hypothetical protein